MKLKHIGLLAFYLLFSCHAKTSLILSENPNQLSLNFSVKMGNALETMIDDWTALTGQDILDESDKTIQTQILQYKGVESVSIPPSSADTENSFELALNINDLNAFQTYLPEGLLKIDSHSFQLTLTTENLETFSNSFSLTKNIPILEAISPSANKELSEKEYNELLLYTLGEEGIDELEKGELIVQVQTPSKITNIVSGKISSSKIATFTIGLKELLFLEEPQIWYIQY